MLRVFPIEFVRHILEQKLLIEHGKDINFFGGKDQVNIMSFYEQLKTQEEVDRFVENYRELSEQQNRTGLILNGVVLSPENPTITNLYQNLIIPMTWTCSLRCLLANRDQAIWTINNLIDQLKGKKVDVAQLQCVDENGNIYYEPFMVGTLGQNEGDPVFKNGDFLGSVDYLTSAAIKTLFDNVRHSGVHSYLAEGRYYYFYVEYTVTHRLYVVKAHWEQPVGEITTWIFEIVENALDSEIPFPPSHTYLEKYKMSFSCDAIRCDEPRNLNSNEYCELTFSGSATLVNNGVQLGNDLLKVEMWKKCIEAQTQINFTPTTHYYLEPLEMPSGNNANTQITQLVSNNFLSKSHTDAIAITLQYSFIYNEQNAFLKSIFNYARYGNRGLDVGSVSPNMVFGVTEHWCSWGNYETHAVLCKLVENVDIENTESDTLTIALTFQNVGFNV